MQKAFGSVLFPPENFYFRQDLKKKPLQNVCSEHACSFVPVGYSTMCLMHYKQARMKSMAILGKIKDKLGNNWIKFMQRLKAEARSENDAGSHSNADGISVQFSFFIDLLRSKFKLTITEKDQETLCKTFSAKTEDEADKRISLKPILQLANHQQMINAYKKI